MQSRSLKQTLCVLALAALHATASADTFELTFTASAFKPHSDQGTIAPPDVLSGSFLFSGNPYQQEAITLLGASLTIEGYQYSAGEIGTRYLPEYGALVFGGSVTGVAGVMNRTNDFFLSFPILTFGRSDLLYSTSVSQGLSYSEQVTYTLSQVPEPASLNIALAGLACIVGTLGTRRRSPVKQRSL